MKKNRVLVFYSLLILSCTHLLHALECSDSLFARYFRSAQHFADTYPREKAHLHFDNTSYYIGDSIWFQAYVTLAEGNLPSMISKPLYVELVDQLGNVVERQIVELQKGKGHGQIALKPSCLPGYYEVRAYTRWMLAFEEKECFSRTFPIYRRQPGGAEMQKSIGTYYMDKSMKQRPSEKAKKFTLRFFPEGGALVRGVPSIVAFEAESRESGPVSVAGVVLAGKDSVLTRFRTLHDGMGYFSYTPGAEPAVAEVEYEGDTYRFPLPEALPEGYVMQVSNRNGGLDVRVTRSSVALTDTLALFVSQQGRPLVYGKVDFAGAQTSLSKVATRQFSGGVTQVSLVSANGNILCERLCYVMPGADVRIESLTPSSAMYQPYAPIHYELAVKDSLGLPVRTHLSVSVRDALNSDYLEYDNTLYTDLLLTSDLKGYIHQPGYYFVDRSPQRQRALDALLLVRGWRKYDMGQMLGAKPFAPAYLPESQLVVHGQIRSSVRQKAKGGLLVSVFARNEEQQVMGSTLCDSLGHFTIPVEAFSGTMDALIQTRKPKSKNNTQTTISLFRNFSPPLREYGHEELYPVYTDMDSLRMVSLLSDSVFEDSLLKRQDFHLLDEVQVKGKKRRIQNIERFEQSINAYYDVSQLLDEMRDKGKDVESLATFLAEVNSNIFLSRQKVRVANPIEFFNSAKMEGELSNTIVHRVVAYYNANHILYFINGTLVTVNERRTFIEDDLDAIKYITLCKGGGGLDRIYLPETKVSLFDNETINEEYLEVRLDAKKVAGLKADSDITDRVSSATYCYITTVDNWKEDKKYGGSWGIRRTQLQGFSRPLEFYSPAYTDKSLVPENDHRRTLYWNPNLETDENGKIMIECYNAGSSTFPIVQVETLCEDGKVASATFTTIQ